MKCTHIEKWLLLASSGEATPRQMSSIRRHLKQCESCRRFAAVEQATKSALKAYPPPDSPPTAIMQTIRAEARRHVPNGDDQLMPLWTWPRLAVAAGLLIVLSVSWLWLSSDPVSRYAQHEGSTQETLVLAWDVGLEENLQALENDLQSLSTEYSDNGNGEKEEEEDTEALARELLLLRGVEI